METKKKEKNELKIIVVGNSGTGKTSFVRKWIKNKFEENYQATIVSEFSYKIIENKGKYYKIQLWDLAGQDQNSCITKIFSRNSHGCIVLTDITDEKSLNESIKWKNSVDDISKFIDGDYLPSILLQNKIDLIDENDIHKFDERINDYCNKGIYIQSFKTSAKLGINIEECMIYLINHIIGRMDKFSKDKSIFDKERKSIVLLKNKNNDENNSNDCC